MGYVLIDSETSQVRKIGVQINNNFIVVISNGSSLLLKSWQSFCFAISGELKSFPRLPFLTGPS